MGQGSQTNARMMHTASSVSTSSDASSSSCAGTVAKQPALNVETITYIGLADLIPSHLRALCTCANLFFTRIITVSDEQYHIEIAALPYYFDADERSRQRHVRTITLPQARFYLLLEYDRHLANLATCDVLESVEQHVRKGAKGATGELDEATVQPLVLSDEQTATDNKTHVTMICESDEITITTDQLRKVDPVDRLFILLKQHAHQPTHLIVLLLRAALLALKQQQARERRPSRREELAHQEMELRLVLTYRHSVQPRLDVMPLHDHRHIVGCIVRVGVPLQFTA